jgi:hypothetical protein
MEFEQKLRLKKEWDHEELPWRLPQALHA